MSALNVCALDPFGHVILRFVGSQIGLNAGLAVRRIPDSPSTSVSRAESTVGATMPM